MNLKVDFEALLHRNYTLDIMPWENFSVYINELMREVIMTHSKKDLCHCNPIQRELKKSDVCYTLLITFQGRVFIPTKNTKSVTYRCQPRLPSDFCSVLVVKIIAQDQVFM